MFGTRAVKRGGKEEGKGGWKKKPPKSVLFSTVNYNPAFLISFPSTMLFIHFQNKQGAQRANSLGEQTVLFSQSLPVKRLIKHIYADGNYGMVAFGKLPHPKGWHKADPEALRPSENRWVLVRLSYWLRLKILFFFCKGSVFQTQNLWG